MTTIIQQSSGTEARQIPIGAKLQSARESMRLDRKDAAAQLRLTENVIDMIENNSFPDSMPQIFIRGYIRSYGKLLQLPDDDIRAAIEPVKPKAPVQAAQPAAPAAQKSETPRNYKRIEQGLSVCIGLVVLFMVGAWWRGYSSNPAPSHATVAEVSDVAAPAGVSVQLAKAAELPPETIQIGAASEPDLEDR